MNRLNKYFHQYLNSKIIFAIDFVLSVLTSVIILFSLTFFSSAMVYRGVFSVWWMLGSVVGTLMGMWAFKCYKVVVRHTTLRDLVNFILTLLVKEGVMGLTVGLGSIFNSSVVAGLICDLLLTLFFLICVRLLMFMTHDAIKSRSKYLNERRRVLIYGTSDKSAAAITRLQHSTHYQVVGFISPDKKNKNLRISDLPVFVFQNDQDLDNLMDGLSVRSVLFASEEDLKKESTGLMEYCTNHGIRTLIAPTIDEVVGNKVVQERVREVKIEDLLGRDEIKISMDEVVQHFKGKVVMVTGAAGSIGSELCRQLAGFGVKKLVLFDNAETPMHNLRLELEARFPDLDFIPIVGDVRHPDRLDYAFRDWHPQVVFHAAAYKHVPLMEENPCEAVMVNVYGTCNVADKCLEYGTEEMVMISTDKAVNPTNIMGCSKRLAEIYVQSLGVAIEKG